MEWHDSGFVLSARGYGENSFLLSILTRDHGRHAGLVRGGRHGRLQAYCQPGSQVAVRWSGRLSGQLGWFRCEGLEVSFARYLQDAGRLAALVAACSLQDALLPERDPCPQAFEDFARFLDRLQQADWPVHYLRWEISLLTCLGYGLDLPRRYPRESNQILVFDTMEMRFRQLERVQAGVLPAPSILIEDEGEAGSYAVVAALAITGHVLANCALRTLKTKASILTLRQRLVAYALGSGQKKDVHDER